MSDTKVSVPITKKILVFTSPPGGAIDTAGALKDSFPSSDLVDDPAYGSLAFAEPDSPQSIPNNTDVVFNTIGGTFHNMDPTGTVPNFTGFAITNPGTYAYAFQLVLELPDSKDDKTAPFGAAIFGLRHSATGNLTATQSSARFDGGGLAFLTGTGQADFAAGDVALRNYSGSTVQTSADIALISIRCALQRIGDLPIPQS